jgi:peptide/nickel transport system substrate-binding protein
MCNALFEGKQKPAAHAFHPMSPYYSTDVKDYAFDLKAAEKLLDEAGWKKGGDGIRTKDGKRLSLQIMSTSQNKTRELVQVFLQEAWKKIGVQLTIRNEPARVFFGGTLAKREYGQLAMYATVLTSPGDIQYAGFHSSQMYRGGGTRAGSNYSGWENPKVDKWLETAKTELDEAKRKVIMKDVIQALVEDAPQIPLFYRVSLQVIPASLNANQATGVVYPSALKAQHWTVGKTAH